MDLALRSHECVLAVVHVGSSAERRAEVGSDIDLAVVVDAPPRQGELRLDTSPVKVDLQFFDTAWLLGLRSNPFLDLRGLREAGRFSRGRVLYSRWTELDDVIAASRRVVISPLEASLLMSGAVDSLHASFDLPPRRRAWEVLGAGLSLGILGAGLTRRRYQKPKWLARDLRAGGCSELVEILLDLVDGRRAWPTERFLQVVRKQVEVACVLRGLPPLLRTRGPPPHAYLTVRDTMKDAAMLLDLGDADATRLVAMLALRYALALLEEPDLGRAVSPERIEEWLEDVLVTVLPLHSQRRLATLGERLYAEGGRLERRFQRAAKLARTQIGSAASTPEERSSLLGLTRLSGQLWMGAHQSNPDLLRALGISTVVLTAAELQPPEESLAPLEVIRVPLEDSDLPLAARRSAEQAAGRVLEKLQPGNGGILVSCHHGMNRSALVAGLVLQRAFGWSGEEVVTHLRRARRGVLTNPTFAEALEGKLPRRTQSGARH